MRPSTTSVTFSKREVLENQMLTNEGQNFSKFLFEAKHKHRYFETYSKLLSFHRFTLLDKTSYQKVP